MRSISLHMTTGRACTSAIVLLSLATNAVADPPVPLADGSYEFRWRDAEFPQASGFPVTVEIRGTQVRVVNSRPDPAAPPGELERATLMWHPAAGKWILGIDESDRHASSIGGCGDADPHVIDFAARDLWACMWGPAGPAAEAAAFPEPTDRIADCENRWFLVAGRAPETRVLGFAYVDADAGVTFEHNGEVGLTAEGQLRRLPSELAGKARLIVRVEENLPVVCLDDKQTAVLGLSTPDWLATYRDTSAAGPHNVRWASHYNHIGAYERALRHIDAARAAGFRSRNLMFEHGYALNALERYSEARGLLESAVKSYPRDPNMIAELGYAQLGLGDFRQSIATYKLAYDLDVDDASGRRSEFAQNMAAAYSRLGNDVEAARWLDVSRQGGPAK